MHVPTALTTWFNLNKHHLNFWLVGSQIFQILSAYRGKGPQYRPGSSAYNLVSSFC